MNSSSSSYLSNPINRKKITKGANRIDLTKSRKAPKPGWENFKINSKDDNYMSSSNSSSSNSKSKKMKFPRRNSLSFPLSSPNVSSKESSSKCNDNSNTGTNRNRSIGNPPLTGVMEKALTILNEESSSMGVSSHSVSASSTSASSTSASSTSASSIDDEEVLRNINPLSKGLHAISTPIPGRRPLQIPAAKRRQMELLAVNTSPTSSTDSAILDSKKMVLPSLCEDNSKDKAPRPASIVSKSSRSSSSSSSTTTSKKVRKPRKRVNFKQTCTMRRTLSRKDMTPKEIRRAWLTAEEYNRMQVRDEILADRIDAGRGKAGTCTRGLESKIERTALLKLDLRMTGIEEVLVEQDRQWDEAGDAAHFFYDFSSFEYVYAPVSEDALTKAQEVAKQDSFEAGKILASSALFRGKVGAVGFLKRSRFTRRRSWA